VIRAKTNVSEDEIPREENKKLEKRKKKIKSVQTDEDEVESSKELD